MHMIDFTPPFFTDECKGIGGSIKNSPEDFKVDEIPAYEPEGQGEHLFIRLTKKGITTKEVQKALAKLFETKRRDVDFAGIKDKHALTTQTFSVWLLRKQDPERIHHLKEMLPVTIHSYAFHPRKIKKGHLIGNHFDIKIRNLSMPIEEAYQHAQKTIEQIHSKGLPNYYGDQRFGVDGDNALQGWEVLKGERKIPNKWLKKFLISSFQSQLFNYYLNQRILDGFYEKLINGDIAKKHDTGGMFVVENLDEEQKRLEQKKICFTGPMFGKKMTAAHEASHEFEQRILTESGVTEEDFRREKVTGTRRAGIILPQVEIHKEEDGLRVNFDLPKGSFATVVLRELMKNE